MHTQTTRDAEANTAGGDVQEQCVSFFPVPRFILLELYGDSPPPSVLISKQDHRSETNMAGSDVQEQHQSPVPQYEPTS